MSKSIQKNTTTTPNKKGKVFLYRSLALICACFLLGIIGQLLLNLALFEDWDWLKLPFPLVWYDFIPYSILVILSGGLILCLFWLGYMILYLIQIIVLEIKAYFKDFNRSEKKTRFKETLKTLRRWSIIICISVLFGAISIWCIAFYFGMFFFPEGLFNFTQSEWFFGFISVSFLVGLFIFFSICEIYKFVTGENK